MLTPNDIMYTLQSLGTTVIDTHAQGEELIEYFHLLYIYYTYIYIYVDVD